MFLLGIRVSTLVFAGGFLLLAPARRDRRFWLAGAAWFFGFEALFETTQIATVRPALSLHWTPWYLSILTVGAVLVGVAARRGVRPSLPLMAAVACIWIAWMATGFHANGHDMVGFSPLAEALNEAAKTGWALAYLWPLLQHRPRRHYVNALAYSVVARLIAATFLDPVSKVEAVEGDASGAAASIR